VVVGFEPVALRRECVGPPEWDGAGGWDPAREELRGAADDSLIVAVLELERAEVFWSCCCCSERTDRRESDRSCCSLSVRESRMWARRMRSAARSISSCFVTAMKRPSAEPDCLAGPAGCSSDGAWRLSNSRMEPCALRR
jgi:hypothetical protein